MRIRSVRWTVLMSAVGLVAGPMTGLAHWGLVRGLGPGSGWLVVNLLFAGGVLALMLALWWWLLAPWCRDLCAVDVTRARVLTALVLVVGAVPWLLPVSLSLPNSGALFPILDWLILTAVYTLAGLVVCPAIHRMGRVVALAATVGLAAGWQGLTADLVHVAASKYRVALGAPTTLEYVVDLPSYQPSPVTSTSGVLMLTYNVPDRSGLGPQGNDLVLTVCPAKAEQACFADYDLAPGPAIAESCRAESSSSWSCENKYGHSSLVRRVGGLVVSLTVNPDSQAPVDASELPALLASAHLASDREILAMFG